MRSAHALALLAFATAGCAPPSPGPKVQAMLDFYAPDLQIGEVISAAAHKRYSLKMAHYEGYSDATFRGPDGVADLLLGVSADTDENAGEELSPRARVVDVTLSIPDSASMFLVEARLQQAFGAPEERCYMTTGTRERWRWWYWPGEQGRGILLTLGRGRLLVDLEKPPGPFDPPPAGSGSVTFGAPVPDFKFWEPDVCD